MQINDSALTLLDGKHAAAIATATEAGGDEQEAAFAAADALAGRMALLCSDSFAGLAAKSRTLSRQLGGPMVALKAVGEEEWRLIASVIDDLAAMATVGGPFRTSQKLG